MWVDQRSLSPNLVSCFNLRFFFRVGPVLVSLEELSFYLFKLNYRPAVSRF